MLTYTLKDKIANILFIDGKLFMLYGDGIHSDLKTIQAMIDKQGYLIVPEGKTYLI